MLLILLARPVLVQHRVKSSSVRSFATETRPAIPLTREVVLCGPRGRFLIVGTRSASSPPRQESRPTRALSLNDALLLARFGAALDESRDPRLRRPCGFISAASRSPARPMSRLSSDFTILLRILAVVSRRDR